MRNERLPSCALGDARDMTLGWTCLGRHDFGRTSIRTSNPVNHGQREVCHGRASTHDGALRALGRIRVLAGLALGGSDLDTIQR